MLTEIGTSWGVARQCPIISLILNFEENSIGLKRDKNDLYLHGGIRRTFSSLLVYGPDRSLVGL